MASDPSNFSVNGNTKSLAAMLEAQHSHDAAHKPTVEDVQDEEVIKHPPPSSVNEQKPAPAAAPTPAQAAPTPAPTKPAPKEAPVFDVQSEELFPALGSGPKPKAPAAATWGAKPSAAAAVANSASGPTRIFFYSHR